MRQAAGRSEIGVVSRSLSDAVPYAPGVRHRARGSSRPACPVRGSSTSPTAAGARELMWTRSGVGVLFLDESTDFPARPEPYTAGSPCGAGWKRGC